MALPDKSEEHQKLIALVEARELELAEERAIARKKGELPEPSYCVFRNLIESGNFINPRKYRQAGIPL